MSTHATIHFMDGPGDEPRPGTYVHFDGGQVGNAMTALIEQEGFDGAEAELERHGPDLRCLRLEGGEIKIEGLTDVWEVIAMPAEPHPYGADIGQSYGYLVDIYSKSIYVSTPASVIEIIKVDDGLDLATIREVAIAQADLLYEARYRLSSLLEVAQILGQGGEDGPAITLASELVDILGETVTPMEKLTILREDGGTDVTYTDEDGKKQIVAPEDLSQVVDLIDGKMDLTPALNPAEADNLIAELVKTVDHLLTDFVTIGGQDSACSGVIPEAKRALENASLKGFRPTKRPAASSR